MEQVLVHLDERLSSTGDTLSLTGHLDETAYSLGDHGFTLPNGIELTAFTTHFVSKVSDPEGTRRLGEAKLTREILDAYIDEHPGRFVIFGGDLNDFPDSEQIQTLETDERLANVTAGMAPESVTTWNDSVTFDYLFYTAGDKDKRKETEVFCDVYRNNGFSSSDHCAVRTVFEFK